MFPWCEEIPIPNEPNDVTGRIGFGSIEVSFDRLDNTFEQLVRDGKVVDVPNDMRGLRGFLGDPCHPPLDKNMEGERLPRAELEPSGGEQTTDIPLRAGREEQVVCGTQLPCKLLHFGQGSMNFLKKDVIGNEHVLGDELELLVVEGLPRSTQSPGVERVDRHRISRDRRVWGDSITKETNGAG